VGKLKYDRHVPGIGQAGPPWGLARLSAPLLGGTPGLAAGPQGRSGVRPHVGWARSAVSPPRRAGAGHVRSSAHAELTGAGAARHSCPPQDAPTGQSVQGLRARAALNTGAPWWDANTAHLDRPAFLPPFAAEVG